MPLMPKRTKFRKMQKGRNRGKPTRGAEITYGEYGLQALEAGWITSNQIEAARIAMTRFIKRGGQVWIKIFPDKPITMKIMKVVRIMKTSEIRKSTSADLRNELVELKSELFKLRFQHAANGLDNPMKMKNIKKDIAKIKTILREREIKGEE